MASPFFMGAAKLNVGAGLLANAVVQSTYASIDTLLSRASPLPHLDLHKAWDWQ